MQIKVAIVDDDEGIRSSLSALIKRSKDFKLTGDFANAENALAEIPRNLPDVVLMDINLPGMKGYDCVRQLKLTTTIATGMLMELTLADFAASGDYARHLRKLQKFSADQVAKRQAAALQSVGLPPAEP